MIDEKKIKLWSSVGSRATFGLISLELVNNNKNLIFITADVSTSAGLDRLKKKFICYETLKNNTYLLSSIYCILY